MKYQIIRESKKVLAILGCLALAGLVPALVAQASWVRLMGLFFLGVCSLSMAIIVYFYRDPERNSTEPPEIIIAPADGYVTHVEKVREDRYLKKPAWRVAVFMHVGNVHIQRVPSAGKLVRTDHYPGKFRPVMDPKAPIENEQRWYLFERGPRSYTLVQIAGLLARRTINWLTINQECSRGIRLGMIALGSEIDLYLPEAVEMIVKPGTKVKGGESIIARWTA
ncbi:phosphatidylserine decarboxylase [bacterium]|nr:phosphatidylserine decarboxylase [bacterium]